MEVPFSLQDLELLWQERGKSLSWKGTLQVASALPEVLWDSLWTWRVCIANSRVHIEKGVLAGSLTLATLSGLVSWHQIKESKQECDAIEKENRLLKEKTETLVSAIRKLKIVHNQVNNENLMLRDRMTAVEDSLTRLLEECPTDFEEREQYIELRAQNDFLKETNENLLNLLLCSICFSNNSDCVLGPCGHTLCSTCTSKINNNWAHSENAKGPICPFCRATVVEVFPKKLKP